MLKSIRKGQDEKALIVGGKRESKAMKLFHTSPENRESIKVKPGGLFGGVFATSTAYYTIGEGKYNYYMNMSEDEILTYYEMKHEIDYDAALHALQKETGLGIEDTEQLFELVAYDDEVEYGDPKTERLTGTSDPAESSWELQRLRGVIAKKLGYHAVECRDEQGLSYLVIKGTFKRDRSGFEAESERTMTSDDYFLQKVLPIIRRNIREATARFGKLRGRGAINKRKTLVEFILDAKDPRPVLAHRTIPVRIGMGGSYMTPDDGEYTVFMHSPYLRGGYEVHEEMERVPVRDAMTIIRTTTEMLADYIR